MKKNNKIIITFVIIAILVISTILFFVVFKDDKDKFIGEWKEIEATTPSGPYKNFSYTKSFFRNNSLKESVINISSGETLFEYWEIYKLEFGKLYFGPDESHLGDPLSYTFSEDDTKLTLCLNAQEYWIYSQIN